jgi:hypothetical protein
MLGLESWDNMTNNIQLPTIKIGKLLFKVFKMHVRPLTASKA